MTTTEPTTATTPTIGTREEWVRARRALLELEKALTRRTDELARQRLALPWVPVDEHLRVRHRARSQAALADLFDGRSQLIAYHFMFGPRLGRGLPELLVARRPHRPRRAIHLEHHDVDVGRRVAGPARQAPRIPGAHGLDVPVGVVVATTTSTSTSRCRRPTSARCSSTTSATLPDDAARRWPCRGCQGCSVFALQRRRRLPHVLGLRPGHGRHVGHVPVARSVRRSAATRSPVRPGSVVTTCTTRRDDARPRRRPAGGGAGARRRRRRRHGARHAAGAGARGVPCHRARRR